MQTNLSRQREMRDKVKNPRKDTYSNREKIGETIRATRSEKGGTTAIFFVFCVIFRWNVDTFVICKSKFHQKENIIFFCAKICPCVISCLQTFHLPLLFDNKDT